MSPVPNSSGFRSSEDWNIRSHLHSRRTWKWENLWSSEPTLDVVGFVGWTNQPTNQPKRSHKLDDFIWLPDGFDRGVRLWTVWNQILILFHHTWKLMGKHFNKNILISHLSWLGTSSNWNLVFHLDVQAVCFARKQGANNMVLIYSRVCIYIIES